MAQTESDAAVRLAEIEAKVRQTEADTARIEAEAQPKKIGAMADIELERAKGLAEAEVARAKGLADAEIMQHKGYTQRDVLQADVQTEYAKSLGQIGANGGNGGCGRQKRAHYILADKAERENGYAPKYISAADKELSLSYPIGQGAEKYGGQGC